MANIERIDSNIPFFPVHSATANAFWEWYKYHWSDPIIKIKFFIGSFRVRLADVEHIFVKFFGPNPYA